MIRNYNKIISQIKNIKFYNIKYLNDISESFYAPSKYLNENISFKNILKRMQNVSYVNNYIVKRKGKKKILLLFSSNYADRYDLQNGFKNIDNLVNDKIVVKANLSSIYCNKSELYILFIWLFQMRNVKASLKVKILYCLELYKTYISFILIKKVIDENKKSLKLIFTYTDMHMIDCLVTKYGNYLGVDTVTLQHGAHNTNKKLIGKDIDSSSFLSKSCSKYMLVYGPQIVKFSNDIGIPAGKMIAVGSIYNINTNKISHINTNKNGVFAIILDGLDDVCNKSDNTKLLLYSDYIAEKYNLKYIVRKHPSDTSVYKQNKSYCLRYSMIKESIEELSKKIDFCIMGNSTVFYNMIYLLIPTYRYVYSDYNSFSDIKWNVFRNENEFEKLIDKYYYNDELCNEAVIKTRDWVYANGDVSDNFKCFFEKFL